jgi:drug/metabolite transporter (DMT)-like permease
MPNGTDWIWILGIGFFTQIGQLCITQGLRLIPAGQATSLNYSQVIFSSVLGWLIFNETITQEIYLGGICVLISTIISMSTRKSSLA